MQHVVTIRDEVIPYEIVRSKRRTIGIVIDEDGSLEVRAPRWVTVLEIQKFVDEKTEWIEKTRKRMEQRAANRRSDWPELKAKTYPWIREEGAQLLEQKINYFADLMGVGYSKVSIKDTKSRWGSCSKKGNINFCWKIFVMPERIADYLIVHELAHRKVMNHSEQFWAVVKEYIPEYKSIRKELIRYT